MHKYTGIAAKRRHHGVVAITHQLDQNFSFFISSSIFFLSTLICSRNSSHNSKNSSLLTSFFSSVLFGQEPPRWVIMEAVQPEICVE